LDLVGQSGQTHHLCLTGQMLDLSRRSPKGKAGCWNLDPTTHPGYEAMGLWGYAGP